MGQKIDKRETKKLISDMSAIGAFKSPNEKREFREGMKFAEEGTKDHANASESITALGAYLRVLRTERGVSLHDVERATGISNVYLSFLERGLKQRLPRPEVLTKLGNYFTVSMKELLQHAGYLTETDVTEKLQDRIDRAFHHVIHDPNYRATTPVRPDQLNLEAKRFIVEIYERATGRALLQREQHRNGNRQDNRIENLPWLSKAEHDRMHALAMDKAGRRCAVDERNKGVTPMSTGTDPITETTRDLVADQAGTPTPNELALDQQRFLAIAERLKFAVRAVDALLCAAIGTRCNPQDFVRHFQGGKESYYLQASGCLKIRAFFGLYLRDRSLVVEPLGKDEKTGIEHYNYEVTGIAGSQVLDRMMGTEAVGGTQLDVLGSRSSKDPFFSKGDREPDQNDVKKAAIANFTARAVHALLGLNNLTRADLLKFGINPDATVGVEHQAGAEGGGQSAVVISENQRKRLWAISKTAKVSEADYKALLTAFGFARSEAITRARYEEIVATVQGGPDAIKAKLADLAAPATPVNPDADDVPFGA